MTVMMHCERCGKEIPKTTNRRFCKECGAARNEAANRRSAMRKYEEKKAAQLAAGTKTIKCSCCGQEIIAAPNRKYCPECAKERIKQQIKRSHARAAQRDKEKTAAEKKKSTRDKLFALEGKSLSEIALEAKVFGMTYGKYVSACSVGTITKLLEADGISRDKARRMIQKERENAKSIRKKRLDERTSDARPYE